MNDNRKPEESEEMRELQPDELDQVTGGVVYKPTRLARVRRTKEAIKKYNAEHPALPADPSSPSGVIPDSDDDDPPDFTVG